MNLLNPAGWNANIFRILSLPCYGTLAIEEAKLPGNVMTDLRTVHSSHASSGQ